MGDSAPPVDRQIQPIFGEQDVRQQARSRVSARDQMERRRRLKPYLWKDVLVLKHGLPSHDTFEAAFRSFMEAFAEGAKIARPQGVIALDGKALRRGCERGNSHMPPLMVTAWAAQTRMALANVLALNNNEAAGALQLLELLQLKGCVVTADALHCHREIAKQIVARGGDYVLAVKENQPALLADARAAIAAAARKGKKPVATTDADHGRREKRSALVVSVKDMGTKHNFPGLKAVARISSKRGKDKAVELNFLLSQNYSRTQLLSIVRTHWAIENGLHEPLDVILDEDLARNRKDNGPANVAVLRRLALNVAKAHPDITTSLRLKLQRAGWNDAFIFELLGHMR